MSEYAWGDVASTPQETAARLAAYFEGCKLTAYQDTGAVWTIGYGHTSGVHAGMTCTNEQAMSWLETDMSDAFNTVATKTHVALTDNQRAALADFVFNLGSGAYAGSTLLRKLNAGDYVGASAEFPRWVHDNGKVLAGLVKRRASERELFDTGITPETTT